MHASHTQISEWIQRLQDNNLQPEEFAELLEAVKENEQEAEWMKVLQDAVAQQPPMALSQDELQRMWEAIRSREAYPEPVKRVHSLKQTWLKYAAAIILICGAGAYLWKSGDGKRETEDVRQETLTKSQDVLPGGNKAILTLADGTTIALDSAANGAIAKQGSTQIEKKDGEIIYTSSVSRLPSNVSRLPSPDSSVSRLPSPDAPIAYNTMSTPRGGQYQLTLPDGSQVWLNAASSITYPTVFAEKERKVTVTGEAYFEIAKNKAMPFVVTLSPAGGGAREASGGGLEIKVLGTKFNTNAYKDEANMKVTLVEGSVSITPLPSPVSRLPSKTLMPGQQASLPSPVSRLPSSVSRLTIGEADIEKDLAWKNGLFAFKKADLPTVMRQLARWYDLEIQYSGNIPQRNFTGEIDRSLTLKQVLNGLSQTRINYELKENKLIIHP